MEKNNRGELYLRNSVTYETSSCAAIDHELVDISAREAAICINAVRGKCIYWLYTRI